MAGSKGAKGANAGEDRGPEGSDAGAHSVITFTSTHQAMAAEDALLEAGVPLEVVPAPPGTSAGCGLALRVRNSDLQTAERILAERGVGHDRIVPTSFAG